MKNKHQQQGLNKGEKTTIITEKQASYIHQQAYTALARKYGLRKK